MRPLHRSRYRWEESFRAMHERGDDLLLDADTASTTEWDEEEWEWSQSGLTAVLHISGQRGAHCSGSNPRGGQISSGQKAGAHRPGDPARNVGGIE